MQNLRRMQAELAHHPVYGTLSDINSLRSFMRHHVFAVWDFMGLLKSLQRHITCVEVPWRPSGHSPELVRLINQIVLGEESDLDADGNAISHFELYLKSMEEVGASTSEIMDYLSHFDVEVVPSGSREFIKHNIDVALNGQLVEVAASFFFGREKLIPDMFRSIVKVLQNEGVQAPTFLYYLERHIEVDEGEHGPMAIKCLEKLIGGDEDLRQLALQAGQAALAARKRLWDHLFEKS